MVRKCVKCGENKPLDAFAPYRKSEPEKRRTICRSCAVVARREWIARNPAKAAEYRERYGEQNKAATAAWRAANPDRVKAWKLREREKNAEYYREKSREWRRQNPERMKQQVAEWIEANPDQHAEIRRRSSRTRRARKAGAFVEHVDSLIVLERADGECGICGEDVDPLKFEVDHIVPIAAGGNHSYVNTQPAHPACNRAKWAWLDYAA